MQLQELLDIPTEASDQDIHELILAGFLAESVKALCDFDHKSPARNQIVPLKTLITMLARGQQLTVDESDRLFRIAHVTAMVEALFGEVEKSKRWLFKPKVRFSGESPTTMLSTTLPARFYS